MSQSSKDGDRRPRSQASHSHKRFDSIHQEAYLSLWRSYDRLRSIEDRLFDAWDVTAQQFNILRLLQLSHPVRMATLTLSSKLVSRAPDITRMLDKLEKKGWIDRSRSETDRRAVMVGITPQGLKLTEDISKPLAASHVEQLGHMSSDELRQLCNLLRKVREPHEPDGSSWR